ncbi:MAG: DpnII family type II restriction endonuclease [Promethearchaeota archaeon]
MTYNINYYQKFFPEIDESEILRKFQENLVKTNRDHRFFVDWNKIKRNAEKFKYELNLLNTLIGTTEFKNEFFDLLRKYPEVIQAFPILIAVRDLAFPVIEDFSQKDVNIIKYSFKFEKGSRLTEDGIKNYYDFVIKTGIIKLFSFVKDFYDYIIGVEVGMDTNARKNRGGKAMELLIEPIVEEISKKYNIKLLIQKKFGYIKKTYNLDIPEGLKNRKCDFLLVKNSNYLNIEVNYYSGSGSKPEEIVDAYINRYHEIDRKRGYFIWITDGEVWNTSENQIDKGFKNLPYLLSINFVRKGLLEEAIKEVFSL